MRTRVTLFIVAFLLPSAVADAQSTGRRQKPAAIGFFVGIEPVISQFNAAAETSGLFGTERIFEHSFHEVYKPALHLGAELAHAISITTDVFGRVSYTTATGRQQIAFGESITRDPPSQRSSFVRPSDYRAWALEIGGRHHLRQSDRIHPYIAVAAGISVVNPITIDPYCGFRTADCRLYERSVVPLIESLVGMSVDAGSRATIDIESGLRYQSGLHEDPSDLGFGFVKGIYTGRRWSIPVTGAVRFRF